MADNKIENIIFDLGNVLIDFDHRQAAKRIAEFSDMGEKEIFELFFDSQLTGLFEEGKISAPRFYSEIKKILNLKLDFRQFVPIWNEIFFFSEKNLQVYDILNSLRKKYKVAILSNINILHLEYIKKTFPVLGALENFLASCELGLRKPEPEIYHKVLEIIGARGANTFYTDDRPELVESAKNLGIQGFVFSGTEQLKKDLCTAGVNIN